MIKEKKPIRRNTIITIISAIIWAVVMLSSSWVLKGTSCYNEISMILITGATLHFLLLSTSFMNEKKTNTND